MKLEKINQAANILYNAKVTIKGILKLPNDCIPQNKEEAYAIQSALVKKYLSKNDNSFVIGKKVGCTNKEAQKQINITEPFYGSIFSNYSSESNCVIKTKDFIKPFLEPEFSFKLNKRFDLSNAPYPAPFPFSINEVYDSIDYIIPSIEIVDSRFLDWTKVGINNLIADNGVNAYWIYGSENSNLDKFDLTNHSVSLYINNELHIEGNSCNVLNNPINSLTWLINTLVLQNKFLPKDSYVSTGTCTPAIPLNKDDNVCADFGKLGQVNFTFI